MHNLDRLLCPAIDPCRVSSAVFDNDAAVERSFGCMSVLSVLLLSLMLQLAVNITLINTKVSAQTAT